jgi:TetR/AcrR family transcriptional regulator, transcriptional repressor of bet genes
MPKLGMEPIRREALVKSAIAEIGEAGSLDVTVSRIAKRAGVSAALAHHYFGGKEDLLIAAMRHILGQYGTAARRALAGADSPRARLDAIVQASFGPENFTPATIAAWLNFYVHAQSNPGARRLLAIYQARLRSNLIYGLRPLVGTRATDLAETIAAMIDGLYIRHALGGEADRGEASARVRGLIDTLLETTA